MSTTFCDEDTATMTVAPPMASPPARARQATVAEATAELDYRIAASFEDRAAAFRMVYAAYVRSGLAAANAHALRVTPYQLLPTTEIFLAQSAEELMFTMSLVMDGELGLPMESVYGDEVMERRQRGLRFGEVSCLADRRGDRNEFLPIMVKLGRLLTQYARRNGLDELLIAVHPKHARFYRRFMGFEVIGEERSYAAVRNRPAVALCMNFVSLRERRPECYEMFFGEKIADEKLAPHPIPAWEQEYFRGMVDPAFNAAPLGGHEQETESEGPMRRAARAIETAAQKVRQLLGEEASPTPVLGGAAFSSAGCA